MGNLTLKDIVSLSPGVFIDLTVPRQYMSVTILYSYKIKTSMSKFILYSGMYS